jgi:hypothetical protein
MGNLRSELRSRNAALRRLYADLSGTAFARIPWSTDVVARQTLGSDERIEHWFLAEHFLVTWNNWQGLFERFCLYFGQPTDTFPRAWTDFTAKCDALVFSLARDEKLDQAIAKSWVDPSVGLNGITMRRGYDIPSIYSGIARGFERAELMSRTNSIRPKFNQKEAALSLTVPDHEPFAMARSVIFEQNEHLVEQWHELPRSVRDQVWLHLRHYLHSVLGVSWLVDLAGPASSVSALAAISGRKQPVSLSLQEPAAPLHLDSPIAGAVGKLFERLRTAISELGYEAVVEDLLSPDMIGGEASLLGSEDVMVVPGPVSDPPRPIVLAVTRGWNGKEPLSFARVMRQVKARLIEANGTTRVVVVFGDSWDSASFEEEHRDELRAHDASGVRFVFVLVGVPDRVLVTVPIEFDRAPV